VSAGIARMQGEGVLTRMPMTLETAELSKGGEDAETSKMQSKAPEADCRSSQSS
jgi:hypothetical protein